MPVFLGEAKLYDLEQVGSPKDYGTPAVLRRQAYWTMLCGGTGQFYGNAYTWDLQARMGEESRYRQGPRVHPLEDFFAALPWYDLVPDQSHAVVTAGLGKKGDVIDPREPERLPPPRPEDRRRRFA